MSLQADPLTSSLDLISNSSDSDIWFLYQDVVSSLSEFQGKEYNPWYGSVVGSILVGLSGIFPLLVIPVDGNIDFKNGEGNQKLKILLSFAVGGLLGDVFLHLLPEAWSNQFLNNFNKSANAHPSMYCGLWVLTGLLVFIIVEKLFSQKSNDDDDEVTLVEEEEVTNNNETKVTDKKSNSKDISGYLNLMANVIDNFTHGLAVGGSFLLSLRVGILSTLAILIHEIPHEVGDFAILLKSGFSRIEAAKLQLITASSSLFGACTALFFSGASDVIEEKTSWILPFTAGGFLHIALVSVLPELLQEKNPRESAKQLISLILGISVMAFLTLAID